MLSVDVFNLEKKNDCDSNFVDIIGNDTNVSEPWVLRFVGKLNDFVRLLDISNIEEYIFFIDVSSEPYLKH